MTARKKLTSERRCQEEELGSWALKIPLALPHENVKGASVRSVEPTGP